MTGATYYPFSAIVGQRNMKDALLCNAVNPNVGGVLISGTRGTAKSTAARSLAHLLPRIRAVADCPYNCPPDDPDAQCMACIQRDLDNGSDLVEDVRTPFVNLPIGATEDRVLGTIDLESAIQEGERSFDPGLLARANRGILYVDEVNLLSDHLVDVLLDAVATGTNRVEREGISVEHPADVMLVGTMNPEEGELRPQLLDRFGLYVEVDHGMAPGDRKAVVRRRTAFDDDPDRMVEKWRDEEESLADRIVEARSKVGDVQVSEEMLDRIVDLCVEHAVDGLRADIVVHRTARALAALDGEEELREAHVDRAAELALGHRSRARRPDQPGLEHSEESGSSGTSPSSSNDKPTPSELPVDGRSRPEADTSESGDDGSGATGDRGDDADDGDSVQLQGRPIDERRYPVRSGIDPPHMEMGQRMSFQERSGRGRRARAIGSDLRGAYCGARRPRGVVNDLAMDATVRAAAPHQLSRKSKDGPALALRLRPSDLREKRRESRVQTLVVFVVDSSGSMGAYERMSAVKGAILSLLEDTYQKRDRVSLVAFRADGAKTLLSPTSSVSRAAQELADLPTGGRTPLAAGLGRGLGVIESERRKRPEVEPLLVLVSDGRPNYAGTRSSPVQEALFRADQIRGADVSAVCFDTETGPVRMGIVRRLADRMDGTYYRLDELESNGISDAVKELFSGSYRPAG